MRTPRTWADWIVAVLLLATVYVLVRPSSKGAQLVTAVGDAMTAIVRNAADLAST